MNQQELWVDVHKGVIICRAPSWLPEELLEELQDQGRLEYSFRFLKAERKAYRKEKPIWVSVWAEKNRVVTLSSLPGPWRNDVTPYLTGIMDAIDYHSVRVVAVCKCPQSGVTEAVHNFVGYCIDRKPGPVMYVFPDQMTAKENAVDRIQPMIERSPRLASYLTGRQDDTASFRINLQHMPIFLGWASSASRLANKPIRYAIADEVDKEGFNETAKETSPLNLIDKRLTTFRTRSKFIKISTPTLEDGNIWVALNESEVIFDLWVVCPDCGHTQKMIFDRILWEGGHEADKDEILKRSLARYSCSGCDSLWDDHKRDRAVQACEWRSRGKDISLFKYLESFKPVKIGFHLPSWYSRFVSMSEAVVAFLKGLKSVDDLKDFMNAHKAEPFIPYHRKKDESRILLLKDTRPTSIVPGGGVVAALTGAADTQDDGFWYEIRAWGWGLDGGSWQVRSGFLTTFDALARVFWDDIYQDTDGNVYTPQLVVMDAMGHRTDEVYSFATSYRGLIMPFQGKQQQAQPYSFTNIEFFPGSKKPIPGGLQLLRANVNYYKNKLSRLLDIAPSDPGAYLMNADMTDDWARQMTVEYVDDKTGLWACPEGAPNHAWDVSVYGLVALDVLGVKYWAREEPEPVVKPETKERKTKKQQRESRW